MASLTGPVYIPAPNPIVPRYGLFRVATGPLDIPINARSGGLQYQITTCNLPLGYTIKCQEDHSSKVIETGTPTITGAPFVVYSAIKCQAIGLVGRGEADVHRLLYEQLVAGEQATVENIFSTGANDQSPSLAAGAVNLGAAAGPVQAVSILENWLYARYGLQGVIHAPILAAPYLKASKVIYQDGNPATSGVWRTEVGTAVSFGNYAGTGPTGQAGGNWIYITGQVAIWRTPDADLFVPPLGQVIDHSTNLVTIVMEREYLITFDCFTAAVQVTLDLTTK